MDVFSSAVFHCLTEEGTVWNRSWYREPHASVPSGVPLRFTFHVLPLHAIRQLTLLLLRDWRCDDCQSWYRDRKADDCHFSINPFSKFNPLGPCWEKKCRRLACNPCGGLHDEHRFTTAMRSLPKEVRRWYGQEGSVQLCEHRSISWADLRTHFDN
jgi:hypothetical protein